MSRWRCSLWGLNGGPPADLYTTEARHSAQSPLLQVDIAHDELGRTERHRIRNFIERHALRTLNRPAMSPHTGTPPYARERRAHILPRLVFGAGCGCRLLPLMNRMDKEIHVICSFLHTHQAHKPSVPSTAHGGACGSQEVVIGETKTGRHPKAEIRF